MAGDPFVPFPGTAGFDWDEGNSTKNWERHWVSPQECEEAFARRPLAIAVDPRHSEQEPRYTALGRTESGRRLFLAFTMRESRVRVTSARDMSLRERRLYAEAEAEADSDVS